MTTTLLKTKFYIPPLRQELVPRPRLIDRLNAGHHRKLTLVSAPAGYGKSTLLSEWVHQADIPVAWLSLDQGENVLSRFWSYFVAALHTIPSLRRADLGQRLLSSLQSRQPPPIDVLLTSLINEISELPERVTLVLDDLHLVTDSNIHEGLIYLLDNLPANQQGLQLTIATRRDPPWPLARLRVHGDLSELREPDLRFIPPEVVQFFNYTMQLGLAPHEIAALDQRTEGWIAGLQMVAISLQQRQGSVGEAGVSSFIKTFTGSHRFIMDYLVEEVLNQQPAEIQNFLLQTSILTRLSAPLCDAVTGRADSQAILTQAEQANMFLIPLDQQRSWYRYHHLFADLMHRKLDQTNPRLIPTLHQRASQWFEEHAYLDEAVLHALAAPDFDRAANLIERHGMQMVVRSELVTLQRWLDALPEETITTRPWLCICHAWARYYVGLREQVEPRLKDAESALQSTAGEQVSALSEMDRSHIAGNIAALRAYIALQNEELDRVEPLAHRALELLPEEDPARATSAIALAAQQAFGTLPEAGYARATSAIALAETPRQQGDLAASEKAYARAKEIAEQSGNLPMTVSAVAYMAYQQAKQGRLHRAHATFLEALALAVGPDGSQLPAAGLPYVKLGDLMREWDELETASKYLEKGIDLCIQWGHADALVTGYTILARVQLAQNDLDRARETFRKAQRLARQTEVDPWAVCWIDDCRLRLWLAAGDLAAAVSWAQTSGLTSSDKLSFVRDLEHVNLARVSLAQGMQQPDGPFLNEALTLLTRLLEAAEGAGWVGRTLEILVLQSLAFNASGEQQAALAALSRALTIGEPEGYMSVFLDEGLSIARLLTKLEEQDIEPQYAHKLLAALAQRTKARPQPTESTDLPVHSPQPPAGQPLMDKPSVEQPLVDPLSERELQVLRWLDTSLSQQQIAGELHIAVSTVRTHIRNIYSKLDVHQRYEAVQIAKQAGLL